jgi:hypothetical protein
MSDFHRQSEFETIVNAVYTYVMYLRTYVDVIQRYYKDL